MIYPLSKSTSSGFDDHCCLRNRQHIAPLMTFRNSPFTIHIVFPYSVLFRHNIGQMVYYLNISQERQMEISIPIPSEIEFLQLLCN